MAFAATMSTKEPRAFSIGPYKVQLFTWTVASGDVAGTITADNLTRVDHVILENGGLAYTAAPTYATNVATLAFTDPAANRYGSGMCIGV